MDRQGLKERLAKLTPEEREKLKEYTDALKEIKKEIKELLNKGAVQEGGDMMHLRLPVEEAPKAGDKDKKMADEKQLEKFLKRLEKPEIKAVFKRLKDR